MLPVILFREIFKVESVINTQGMLYVFEMSQLCGLLIGAVISIGSLNKMGQTGTEFIFKVLSLVFLLLDHRRS